MAIQEGAQPAAERRWNGHLLQVCGSCDPAGVSTFAYVKYFSPIAWGHNMKRAFNSCFWKHAILFTLLFSAWAWFFIGAATHAGVVCGPPPPQPHGLPDTPMDGPGLHVMPGLMRDPQEQVFLNGATWEAANKPGYAASDTGFQGQDSADTPTSQAEDDSELLLPKASQITQEKVIRLDNVQKEVKKVVDKAKDTAKKAGKLANNDGENALVKVDIPDAAEQLNAQILAAKQQVAEGMAQLNDQLGRKLLHKHEEEEEEDKQHKEKKAKKNKKEKKEKMDEEEEEEHKEKKAKKKEKMDKAEKKAKHNKHADDDSHAKGHHEGKHHHEHGPESPECAAARRSLVVMWVLLLVSTLFGVHYAARMRTAIRQRFGIPGSRLKDCFAWLCCGPCALCQETRTLALNNVHSGVWFGPTMLAAPAAHPFDAPKQQAATKQSSTETDPVAKV